LTVTKSTPLDKYLSRSEDDISSYENQHRAELSQPPQVVHHHHQLFPHQKNLHCCPLILPFQCLLLQNFDMNHLIKTPAVCQTMMKTLIEYENNNTDFTPLRLIVAGCGKSYFIKCLVKAVKCFTIPIKVFKFCVLQATVFIIKKKKKYE
jgi:hypothetical protein